MKTSRTLPALFCGAALALGAQSSHAAPPTLTTITFAVGDMTQAPGGRPFPEVLVAFMRANGPPMNYQIIETNARRAWQMIGGGAQICRLSAVRTPERDKQAYFRDTIVSAPEQLIVRRDRQQALPHNAAGEVDLTRLVADPQLRGAIVDGRSYGDSIDAVLDHLPPDAKVSRYAASDFGSRMLSMLSRDRADYTIDYEVNLVQLSSHDDAPLTASLVSEPIAGASAPVVGGIACPRTPWGLAAISLIDEVLSTTAGALMLRREAERWMTPETRQRYAAQLDAFYREHARPSPPH